MVHAQKLIPTPDGNCPAHLFYPDGAGPFPAVLIFMDGLGIRPTITAFGERLASNGYYALLPDLFYRAGPYEPFTMEMFSDPAKRERFMKTYFSTTGNTKVAVDGRAFLEFMDRDPAANATRIGTTGYCMGGGMSLTAAGTFPDRVAAACSFHGGNLASDLPVSPHLLAPRIKARLYVGGAREDASFPKEQADKLREALQAAGVNFALEDYDAKHGWTMSDTPVYDRAEAERHWTNMLALFDSTLKSYGNG